MLYFKTAEAGWQLARGGDSGGWGEQEPLAHHYNVGSGKAVQRARISGGDDNCKRGARSAVLASTPEDSERQELYTITGIDRTQGGGR